MSPKTINRIMLLAGIVLSFVTAMLPLLPPSWQKLGIALSAFLTGLGIRPAGASWNEDLEKLQETLPAPVPAADPLVKL